MNREKTSSIVSFAWPQAFQSGGLAALAFTLIYGRAGLQTTLLVGIVIFLLEWHYQFRKNLTQNPYLFMFLAPVTLMRYTSITDFRIRTLCFLFFLYIFQAALVKGKERGIGKGKVSFNISLKNATPVNVFLTAFIIFALTSTIFYLRGIHLSGDEPHYLMITQSLLQDGDFDLKNNVQEKTYLDYIPVEVRFHGGIVNRRYLSFHLPGVSFLMLPFFGLYKLLGGGIPPALFFRLSASLINAFFALALFYLLQQAFPKKDITGGWLLVLTTFPLLFHAIHIYPELPAATLMMTAYLFTKSPQKRPILTGLLLSLIPWFHVKYLPALAVLGLVILYRLFKSQQPGKAKLMECLKMAIFPVIVLGLLIVYCKLLYNSFSPTDIFPKESYWTVPFLLRVKVFLAYFLDQRDGLLFYSPMFFLFFWGIKRKFETKFETKFEAKFETKPEAKSEAKARTKRDDKCKPPFTDYGLLLGIAASYVGFHAFTSVRGAFAPAGRPLMFISWILIIFILRFYYHRIEANRPADTGSPAQRDNRGLQETRFSLFLFRALAGITMFVTACIFYYPQFLYQPVFSVTTKRASDIHLFLGSSQIQLWKFFPSFLTSPKTGHPATWVWVGLLAAALVVYYGNPFKKRLLDRVNLNNAKQVTATVLIFAFTFLYSVFPHVQLRADRKHTGKRISFFNNSRNFTYLKKRDIFRVKGGGRYDLYIDRNLVRSQDVTFRLTHLEAVDVTVRSGKNNLFRSSGKHEESFTIAINKLRPITIGKRPVLHLEFDTHIPSAKKDVFLMLEITN